MKKLQSDELYPRHVKALYRAARYGQFNITAEDRELAREAMKIVRELAAQHKITRKYRN